MYICNTQTNMYVCVRDNGVYACLFGYVYM